MKKSLKNLKHINRLIEETESEIRVVAELPFYSIFRKEDERENELSDLRKCKRDLLSQKQAVLEKLSIDIEMCKQEISRELRDLTLTKHAS